jgi:hypothetical protein
VSRDVPDAVDIGHRRSAEFEHQQGHLAPSTTEGPASLSRPAGQRVFHTD